MATGVSQLANIAASNNVIARQMDSESSLKWIFSDEQLLRVPSIRDGLTPAEELDLRRLAAHTIHQMADRLNHESRVRISQLCMCAAMMHMHRFFVFHSFKKFDARDIAAACLFLAGKSEECPRKLEHVVRVWWAIKFPFSPTLDNDRYHNAAQLIVTLENVVLQTIAFDLTVDIPHPYVLKQMQEFMKGNVLMQCNLGNRKLSEIAYWFASDMLHMTNWGVRYPAKSIACVCIQMACSWAGFEIQLPQPWFLIVDPGMTRDKLMELTEEFSEVYKIYGEQLSIRRYVKNANFAQKRTHSTSQSQAPQSSLANLPPPPLPPTLSTAGAGAKPQVKTEPARKIDIRDYKQRAADTPNNVVNHSQQPPQRRNFMQPDIAQVTDLPLPPLVKAPARVGPSKEQESVVSQKRRPEGQDKDILKHRRQEGQEKEQTNRRPEGPEKELMKQRRSEDSHHRKRPHDRNSFSQDQPAASQSTAQYGSVAPPRETIALNKKPRQTSTSSDLNASAPSACVQSTASIPLPSTKTAASSSLPYSSSQQHRISSRSSDGSHRIPSSYSSTVDSRNANRVASPAVSNSSSQRQLSSSRLKGRDTSAASIPLPPGDALNNGNHANNSVVSSNSVFPYAKRPQRPISPPPMPSANHRSPRSNAVPNPSRVVLPPPPIPPSNDELEDGEVL